MVDAIDRENATRWAMQPVSDSAYLVAGYATFNLLNRETWREHKLYSTGFGPAITFALKSSKWGSGAGYKSFETKRPASFDDFDRANTIMVSMGGGGLGLGYSYIKVRIWDPAAFIDDELAVVTMKGAAAMLGFKVKSGVGNVKIDFGSGNPSDRAKGEVVREMNLDTPAPPTERLPGRVTISAYEDPRIVLPADTLFAFGSSVITSKAEEALDDALAILNDRKKMGPLYIEGHADSIGDNNYNKKLSLSRANSVGNWLKAQGVLGSEHFIPIGYGEDYPVASNEVGGRDNPIGRAQNRRVVITYEFRPVKQ